jgi:hypothetical protein
MTDHFVKLRFGCGRESGFPASCPHPRAVTGNSAIMRMPGRFRQ